MAATKTKLPPNPLLSEVLDVVSKARSKTKKIEILKEYDSPAIRAILIWNFDESLVSILPEGKVPYTGYDEQNTYSGGVSGKISDEVRANTVVRLKDDINQSIASNITSPKAVAQEIIEQTKNNRERLVITSIPYQVNKSNLNERIAELVREKKIEGIKDIRDESNIEGIRVAIDLRSNVEPETIKRQLFKYTTLESSFGFNSLAIVDGKPKPNISLKEFLESFLKFREDVVVKRTKYDLKKA